MISFRACQYNGGQAFLVMALVEQIVDIANICISDNFCDAVPAQSYFFCNLFMGPSQKA